MSIITASSFRSTGITIKYGDPLFFTDRQGFIATLNKEIDTYSQVLGANGGYVSASITLKLSVEQAEEWIENGLGRHVVTYDPGTNVIFEGIVNDINLVIGGLTVTHGPYLDIINRALAFYTPLLDVTVDPPITGSQTSTVLADDTDSQALYGILEGSLALGTITDDVADDFRDTFIEDRKWPRTTKGIAAAGEVTVTINCVGYHRLFEKYVFTDTATGYTTFSAKLQEVIIADPNSIFSIDFTDIETNAQVVIAQELENRTAAAIIKAIVAPGDINFNRFIFSVGENRKSFYGAIPTEVEYTNKLREGFIRTPTGQIVEPWNVEAGKWLRISDFLIGRAPSPESLDALKDDPRTMFIETVTFTTPYDLQINGERISTLKQKIEQLGVGGMT